MTGPDKIWARDIDGTGSMHMSWKFDTSAVEYTRSDLCRTAAHPVTVEMLERWADMALSCLPEDGSDCATEMRAAIAQMAKLV